MVILRETIVFKGFRGVPRFPWGGGGVELLISIGTYRT